MAIIPIRDVGTEGFLSDKKGIEVPPHVWDKVLDAVASQPSLENGTGRSVFIAATYTSGMISENVLVFSGVFWNEPSNNASHLFLFGDTAIYEGARTALSLLSGGLTFSGQGWPVWTGGLLGNVPVYGAEGIPAVYFDASATAFLQVPGLDYSISGKPFTSKVIRACGNYLVALDVTKPSGRFSNMVKWSSSADPGSLPASWDEADPTNDAGENTLGDNSKELWDIFPLKDFYCIYGSEGIWLMSYIGYPYIWDFKRVFAGIGAFCSRCAVHTPLGQVALVTGDVILHDGYSYKSIATNRVRKAIFSSIGKWASKCFLAADQALNEVWICVPEDTLNSNFPGATLAFIWNWVNDSWYTKTLPGVTDLTWWERPWKSTTISEHTEIISTNTDVIAEVDPQASKASKALQGSFNAEPLLASFYSGFAEYNQSLSAAGTAVLEKHSLAVVGQDSQGNLRQDTKTIKLLTEILPVWDGDPLEISCWVCGRMSLQDTISWVSIPWSEATQSFHTATTGRYLGVKFEITSQDTWTFEGYDLDLTKIGTY